MGDSVPAYILFFLTLSFEKEVAFHNNSFLLRFDDI